MVSATPERAYGGQGATTETIVQWIWHDTRAPITCAVRET
jgi:hypothetical protein